MPAQKRARSTSSEASDDSRSHRRRLSTTTTASSWPAPLPQIEAARSFILECVSSRSSVLLVPDKDADGLCSGTIMRQTLIALGKAEDKIKVHFVKKGGNCHQEDEKIKLEALKCEWAIVLDQGSRGGPAIVGGEVDVGNNTIVRTKCLVIDHHFSEAFPDDAVVCTACNSPPIATSSLLTYIICTELLTPYASSPLSQPSVLDTTLAWLAVTGHLGDMSTCDFSDPLYPPLLHPTQKSAGKSAITKLISLLNAPRRSPTADPTPSWSLLQHCTDCVPPLEPKAIVSLVDTTEAIKEPEMAKAKKWVDILDICRTNTVMETETNNPPPIFAADGRLAVLTISSAYQIHPLVATKWSGFLKSKKLIAVGCANTGYLDGKVNLSCRLAKRSIKYNHESLSKTEQDLLPEPNIIALLREYAASDAEFSEKLAEAEEKGEASFGKGHKEAAGGSLTVELWNMFRDRCLRLGVKDGTGTTPKKKIEKDRSVKQKNTLDGYFGRKPAK